MSFADRNPTKGPVISCTGLEKSFGKPPVRVLSDIHLKIEGGEFVALTGRSGSGKSTLLYLLSGLDEPGAGEVLLHGENVNEMESEYQHKFRNRHIGFVFQFHYLLPEITALENVLIPTRKSGVYREKMGQARDLLHDFGLDHCLSKYPSQMSGGETQRCAIARSLIMEPDILFTDEPTGNLDTANGELVLNLFEKINREKNTTIVMVTHDPDFAARAGREVVLVDGRIDNDTTR